MSQTNLARACMHLASRFITYLHDLIYVHTCANCNNKYCNVSASLYPTHKVRFSKHYNHLIS